ncbi:MAG: beta-galactosidase [Verrucomicrobia bacterium]|nr:beta-galactosidase [Verrucomicrobiota bacterium]
MKRAELAAVTLLLMAMIAKPTAGGVQSVEAPTDAGGAPSQEIFALTLNDSRTTPSWILNRAQCRVVTVEKQRCLQIESDTDAYSKVEWHIQFCELTPLAGQSVVLEIEFLDQGAGVIEPRLLIAPGVSEPALQPARKSSYTRLNTLQLRRGWFEFQIPTQSNLAPGKSELRITGLQHLKGIRLLPQQSEAAWNAMRSSVPKDVRPMVKLKKPMELVTTAGVDVLGDMSALSASLDALNDLAPLARVLGFTSIESYVTWKRLEPRREGEFDFSFYDAIVKRLAEYKLKWFPLLIVGSGYALPDWFLESKEYVGFVCLEHGLTNSIQSIWSPYQRRHVTRFLQAFGQHYEPMGVLEGVRLGPSGNYGESQYPASGSWGAKNEKMHIHVGWWAGDTYGREDFRRSMQKQYKTVDALNQAWESNFHSFDEINPVLPITIISRRQRVDFAAWYTDSMSAWCEWWAREARRAMPKTRIYQSAGGWGFREAGTDYSAQTKAMKDINGGVRLTNETDSYEQNFYATHLAATAARLYGASLGYEPAGSHTARGTVARIFNTTATKGDHLFTYHGNVFNHQLAIAKWLKYLPVLDSRQNTIIDVAVYYPETENQLSDAPFRYLYAWGFNPIAREIRRVVDVDYLDERLIRDGFLDRYKVLVFTWGNRIEADVQKIIDAWLRKGGTVIYPSYPRQPQETIEGDTTIFQRWMKGDTGRGTFYKFEGDVEPLSCYGDFAESVLRKTTVLHPLTRKALAVTHPDRVFFSVQQDGHLLALNYDDKPARVKLAGQFDETIESYGIARIRLRQ